jgi:hypothetical protein
MDVVLFGGFILAFLLDLTGVELHQWIGVAGGLLAVYHLLQHREWVDAVGERFFGRTSGRARLYFVLDTLLFAGFALMVFTGLLISTWLNLALSSQTAWLVVHILVSVGTLLILLLKLGLHWRWIVKAAGEALGRPAECTPAQPGLQPAPVRVVAGRRYSRREFLQMMGVVGAASALALLHAGSSLAALQQAEPAESATTASTSQADGAGSSTWALSGSACQVQCDRGCAFPGRCRRYVDANDNQLCDLGECV